MAEIPEYKSKVAIQPNSVPMEFAKALSGTMATTDFIGQLGAEVALSASVERNKQAGYEAATKNPGQKMIPSFTAADKAYTDAYKTQEYAIASNNANTMLSRITAKAMQNPNAQTLMQYEEAAHVGIEQITQNLTPGNRRELQMQMQSVYNSNKIDIENKIFQKGQVIKDENFKESLDYGIQNIQKLQLEGDAIGSEALQAKMLDVLNDESITDMYSPSQIHDFKKILNNSSADAVTTRIAHQKSAKPGELEAYLAKLSELPPTEDNLRKMKVALGVYQQKRSLDSAQQSIIMNEATTKLVRNEFQASDLVGLKEQLNAENFSAFELKMAQQFAKKDKEERDFSSIRANPQNAAFLATMDAATANAFLIDETAARVAAANALGIPMENDLIAMADVAQDYKMPFPELTKSIDASIKYGTPEELATAGSAIKVLQANNPIAIKGLDKDARTVSTLFNAYRANSTKPTKDGIDQEAAQKARDDVYNLTDEVRAERLRKFEFEMSDKKYNTNDLAINKKIQDGMGYKNFFSRNTKIPAGLTETVRILLPSYYTRTNDMDMALNEIFEDLKPIWNQTNINDPTSAPSEVIRDAPTTVLQNYEVGNWIQNDKAYAFHKFVQAYKLDQTNDPNSVLYSKIEWPDNPFEGRDVGDIDMIGDSLVNGKLMAMVDGQECQIIVNSDPLTRFSAEGEPSWNFQYIPKGSKAPPQPFIQNPDAGVMARWYPDYELRAFNLQRMSAQERLNALNQAKIYDEMMQSDAFNPELARAKYLKEQETNAVDPDADWLWIKEMNKAKKDLGNE